MQSIFAMRPDIIIPPINGAYGDPAQFLAACKQHAPGVQPRLMSQGELYIYSADASRSR